MNSYRFAWDFNQEGEYSIEFHKQIFSHIQLSFDSKCGRKASYLGLTASQDCLNRNERA